MSVSVNQSINFNNPMVSKPGNLQNSAVLRMLEEEEQRQRNGQPPSDESNYRPLRDQINWPPPEYVSKDKKYRTFKDVVNPGLKRVAWPPPREGEEYTQEQAVYAQGGSQISSPGLQNNHVVPQQQPQNPNQRGAQSSVAYQPVKSGIPSQAGPGSPGYQQRPISPLYLNQTPSGFTSPTISNKSWAPVQSPVTTPNQPPQFKPVQPSQYPGQQYQNQQSPNQPTQFKPVQPSQYPGQQYQNQQSRGQQYNAQRYINHQYPGQQYLDQQYPGQQPSPQYQSPGQQSSPQYQSPGQQPSQQYQSPGQQPSPQYQSPGQQSSPQYQSPGQQYQSPQFPGQQPSSQYQSPQYQSQQQPFPQNQLASAPQGAVQNQNQQQYQPQTTQAFKPVTPVEPPPSTITLRPKAPVSQAPPPVVTSQPATATLKGGKHLRGDLKWPPENVRQRMADERQHLEEIAKGPAFKPHRVEKDYQPFFARHALNSTYPGYKIPPGTQFYLPDPQ